MAAASAPPSSSTGPSPSTTLAIEALLAARPPASDRFTYLTLIEEHLSPEVLPTLHDVLQDAPLTQELGWDLVDMLVPLLPASEACLDVVARLGNPREVILKVLEVLERLRTSRRQQGDSDEYDSDGDDDSAGEAEEEEEEEEAEGGAKKEGASGTASDDASTQAFVALLGMLAILHRRLKTKYPSRFLETTLRTILAAYRPNCPAMTTAVLGLVRSLAQRHRPAPPIRRSDSQLSGMAALAATTSNTSSASKKSGTTAAPAVADDNASASAIGKVGTDHERPDAADVRVPDPEAEEQVAPAEGAVQQRLLQAFVTCVLDAYVNANNMAWAPRLVEYYNPGRLVPLRSTELQDFREDPVKIARDQCVSQLVALALDLGLKYSDSLVQSVSKGPVRRNPFAGPGVAADGANSIPLSTGGVVCLLAYWVFASDVFKADAAVPNLRVFPDHYAMLEAFFDGNAAAQIARTPGTVDSLVAIGLWLDHHGLYSDSDSGSGASAAATPPSFADNFMPYHHLLTLCAVFHPSLAVRNAATTLAGAVLHANPDAEDRLKILQDLLENCMFASLKACAVAWLREEIVAATAAAAAAAAAATGEGDDKTAAAADPTARSLFGGPDAVEQLQYTIFPDLQELPGPGTEAPDGGPALLEYWVQNAPFLLQAANFAYFLFCSERLKATVVPPGMGPAIEQRYVEPLMRAASRLRTLLADDGAPGGEDGGAAKKQSEGGGIEHIALDLDILGDRLSSIKLS